MSLPDDLAAVLRSTSTATLYSQLQRRGIQNCFLEGLRPTRPDLRLVGVARTLRYVALREDVRPEVNEQKRVIDSIEPGEVLVIEARGEQGAGTIGDILALRVQRRGGGGVITDGGLRDSAAIAELDLPVYGAARHAAVLGRKHIPLDADLPVTCAGVLVMPGDVLVGDADGVIVIPADLVADVAAGAAAQDREEQWILDRVAEGEPVTGLFPMNSANRQRYDEWSR
jgi:5-oxopent-3-ene-1,2,5-tricarboxylate decarboxylase / 2-hydroxyhepta-2,4-diene-1,7-dioate isomerase